MVLNGKSSQEYSVNVGVSQGSILVLYFFLLSINDIPDDIICNIAIYVDAYTLFSKCDQGSELESYYETVVGSDLLEGGSGRLPPLQNDNFS